MLPSPFAAMKRSLLAVSIAACSIMPWTIAAAAKPGKNQQRQQQQPATPPPAAAKPAEPDSKPLNEELPSPWHVWSDPAGNKLEAEFCSLYGSVVTVRTPASSQPTPSSQTTT